MAPGAGAARRTEIESDLLNKLNQERAEVAARKSSVARRLEREQALVPATLSTNNGGECVQVHMGYSTSCSPACALRYRARVRTQSAMSGPAPIAGYGSCSKCVCPGFYGSGHECTRGGCNHHFDDHW